MDLPDDTYELCTTITQIGETAKTTEGGSDELHIAYCSDRNFIRPTGISILSVLANNPDLTLIFHIMATDIDADDMDRFHELSQKYHTEIRIYHVDESKIPSFRVKKQFPKVTYLRFYLPILIKPLPVRLLYLDGDILCLKSIRPLMDLDLGEKTAAVVHDSHAIGYAARTQRLGLLTGNYFNSGVLLIDTTRWKDQNFSAQCISVALSIQPDYLDQDTLNIVLEKHVAYISRSWNYLCSSSSRWNEEVEETVEASDIVFMHFVGSTKPWHAMYVAPLHAQLEAFRAFYFASPWRSVPLDSGTTKREYKRFARDLWQHSNYFRALEAYIRYLARSFPR